MNIRPLGDRVHLAPVTVKSKRIDLLGARIGLFRKVIAVGRGQHSDCMNPGDIVALRQNITDSLCLDDGTMMVPGSDVWCVLRGDSVYPVGPRAVIVSDSDPEEMPSDGGILLLKHDMDFPTTGTVNGRKCLFNNKSHQLRFCYAGMLWVVGDTVDTFVGWAE